jgi:uncharacterized protein YhhL (DUF1145 family)
MKLNRNRLLIMWVSLLISLIIPGPNSNLQLFLQCLVLLIGIIWFVTGEDKV